MHTHTRTHTLCHLTQGEGGTEWKKERGISEDRQHWQLFVHLDIPIIRMRVVLIESCTHPVLSFIIGAYFPDLL